MKQIHEVAVVGAGPAGSTAAYYLADMGMEVLLVDRQEFPRYKACGGALFNCRRWRFENYLNIAAALKSRSVNEAFFYWKEQELCGLHVDHLFDHVQRFHFDKLLLDQAVAKGASFQRFHLREISEKKDVPCCYYTLSDGSRTINARYLIGADGFHGVVSRYLGNPRTDYGLCQEYDIVCDSKDTRSRFFFLWGDELGYAWLFPSLDGYYAGVGCIGKTRRKIRYYLDTFLAHIIRQGFIPRQHHIRRRFGGPDPVAVVPNYWRKRIALCGDAMGLVSQLAGDGIYYAMASGRLAARSLREGSFGGYGEAVRPLIDEVTLFRRLPPKVLCMLFSKGMLLAMTKLPALQQFIMNRFFMRGLKS